MTSETDFGWSGVVVRAAASGIVSVSGQWTVPNFSPSASGASHCSIWVGIDGKFGASSFDVLQAGVGCDFNDGNNMPYAWYEWAPDPPIPLLSSQMPVSVGDVISCSITGQISSNTATIELRNLRPGAVPSAFSIQVLAMGGRSLQGGCAEWVVEAPRINGNPTTLCNYGEVQFSGCRATDANGNTLDPSDGIALNLQQGGEFVSYGSSPGPGLVICSQRGTDGPMVAANTIPARTLPASVIAASAIPSRALPAANVPG